MLEYVKRENAEREKWSIGPEEEKTDGIIIQHAVPSKLNNLLECVWQRMKWANTITMFQSGNEKESILSKMNLSAGTYLWMKSITVVRV